MTPAYPSREWFKENFERWSSLVNMKFIHQTSSLVLGEDGVGKMYLTEAVDQKIQETADAFISEGVPSDIVDSFKYSYGNTQRDQVLNSVCFMAITMAPVFAQTERKKRKKSAKQAQEATP